MGKNYGNIISLAERIEDVFPEIDSDVCMNLKKTNSEYAAMYQQARTLQEEYPSVTDIAEIGTSDHDAISLSAEEHKALAQLLSLRHEMENMERKQIYLQGHRDNYSYLVEVAGLHID